MRKVITPSVQVTFQLDISASDHYFTEGTAEEARRYLQKSAEIFVRRLQDCITGALSDHWRIDNVLADDIDLELKIEDVCTKVELRDKP